MLSAKQSILFHCQIKLLHSKLLQLCIMLHSCGLLPARASEQGNVVGLVSMYIYICHQKKIVIERTRDLIYLKFVVTDFSPKIICPSADENSGDSA